MIDADLFKNHMDALNNTISNRVKLIKAQKYYYETEESNMLSIFQPFRSRLAFAARKLKILPSFMSRNWKLALYNYIICESHRDKMEFFLKKF